MNRCKFLMVGLVLAALAHSVMAQSGTTIAGRELVGNIRGHILLPNGAPFSQAVRITLIPPSGTTQVIYTDNQGQFDFKRIRIGIYQVEADADPERFEVVTQSVEVFKDATVIADLTLKEKKAEGPAAGHAIISTGELDPNIPKDARKEFDRATKAAADKKPDEAINHLRKALAIYPDYMMAHNDLGAQLLEAGRLAEATAELRMAIKLDPKAFNPQLNLGLVLLKQEQFTEAARVLDTAIALDAQPPAAHLYDGIAHMMLKELDRAEKELRAAHDSGGAEYALALFHLGQIYLGQGDRLLALQNFETYLREAPDAANAAQVRQLIGKLREQ
jgi:tetratricopeptide (TPR) repeat protein